jgi:MraZ protein
VVELLPLHHLGSTHFFQTGRTQTLAFRGAFDYTLDAKNRLTVPAKFRATLSEGVVLAKGVEPCVAVWRASDYESFISAALQNMNPMSSDYRDLQRFLNSNAFDVELDGAGRVMVPPKLMSHAGLSKEVVVSGAGDCLEVWDRGRWQTQDDKLTTSIPDLTARLGHPA